MDGFWTFWKDMTVPQAIVVTAAGAGIVYLGKSFFNSGKYDGGGANVDNRNGKIGRDNKSHCGDSASPSIKQTGFKTNGDARIDGDLNINQTASQRNDLQQRSGNRQNGNFGYGNRIDER